MSNRDLCIMACVFCKDPQFWSWMADLDCDGTQFDEVSAKAFILAACKIKSRNELDTNPRAADLFHRLVRAPFLAWKGGDHVDD